MSYTKLIRINKFKINCKDCETSYVGQTKRRLTTRIKEHINTTRIHKLRTALNNKNYVIL